MKDRERERDGERWFLPFSCTEDLLKSSCVLGPFFLCVFWVMVAARHCRKLVKRCRIPRAPEKAYNDTQGKAMAIAYPCFPILRCVTRLANCVAAFPMSGESLPSLPSHSVVSPFIIAFFNSRQSLHPIIISFSFLISVIFSQ